MEAAYRETRRQLRSDFERLASFGTWERFLDTGQVRWSTGMHRVLGIPESEDARREAFVSLLHPEDFDRYDAAVRRLERDGESFDVDLRIIRRDGETRTLRVLGYRVEEPADDRPRLVGALQDVTHQQSLEAERARLLATILEVTDDERRRLAVRIHDDVIQHLAIALRRAEAAGAELGQRRADELREPILDAAQSLRAVLADLDPPDVSAGQFRQSLHDYTERVVATDTDVDIEVGNLSGASRATLSTALRMAREAIVNAERHARARRISVAIDTSGSQLRARIEDDGDGYDTAAEASSRAGHMGLQLMQQRADELGGDLTITSSPGAGTTVCFELPLDPVAAA